MTDDEHESDSGPFCRHWHDPTDCEVECANCHHRCGLHSDDQCFTVTFDTGACECTEWKEPNE